MSLATSLWILRYKWNSLPVTTDVVHRIHQLARPSSSSKKKQQAYNKLTFEWASGSPLQPLSISDLLPLLGASEEPSSEQEQPPFQPTPKIPS